MIEAPERQLTGCEQAVRDAAEVLDERGPADWRERIDFDTLNLTDCDVCMLGQIFGSFANGIARLNLVVHHFRTAAFSGAHAREMEAAWREYLENY